MVDLSQLRQSVTDMTNDELNKRMVELREQRRRPSIHAKKKEVKARAKDSAADAVLLNKASPEMAQLLLDMIEKQGGTT